MRMVLALIGVFCFILAAFPVFAQPGAPWAPAASIPAPAIEFSASEAKLRVYVPAGGKATFYYDWDLLDRDGLLGPPVYDVGWNGSLVLDPGAPNIPFKGTAQFNFMRVLPSPTFHCTLSGEYDGTLTGGPWRNYLRCRFTDAGSGPGDMTVDQYFLGSDGNQHPMAMSMGGSSMTWRIQFIQQ